MKNIAKKLNYPRRVSNLLYGDWLNDRECADIVSVVEQMQQMNAITRGPHGKLTLRTMASAYGNPWYFIKHGLLRECLLWHDFYFEKFGIIPSECMIRCWKTVIQTHSDPSKQTVYDLFVMRDFLTELNLPSKCGVDIRLFTPMRYAGFVYGDSIEQGKEYHAVVSERIKKVLPNAKVILKRSCTEFEQKYPKSETWRLTEEQIRFEDKLASIFEPPPVHIQEFDESVASATFRFWILHAHGIGDTSWRAALEREGYESIEQLFNGATTYHEKSVEEIYRFLHESQQEALKDDSSGSVEKDSKRSVPRKQRNASRKS